MTPWLLRDIDSSDPCTPAVKGNVSMICPSFKFILYYMITTVFWDLLPIGLLLIFHYRNFRTSSFNVDQSTLSASSSLYSDSSKMSTEDYIRHKKWQQVAALDWDQEEGEPKRQHVRSVQEVYPNYERNNEHIVTMHVVESVASSSIISSVPTMRA